MVPNNEVRQVLESAGLVQGLAVSEIHARLATGLRLQDTGQRVLAFYLNEMENGRLYQSTGHSSTVHYAETRLGLDRRRTGELIAVGKKLLTLPVIDHAFCKQEIGWSKVLLIAPVATPEYEEEWLALAAKKSARELSLEVRLAKPGGPPRDPNDRKGLPEIRFKMEASLPALTHQKLELAKQKLSAECGRPVNDAELLDVMAETLLSMEEDGSVPGKVRVPSSLYRIVCREDGGDRALVMDSDLGPIPIGDDHGVRCDAETVSTAAKSPATPTSSSGDLAPKTPPALRQRVLARDGNRCRCCGSRRRLMVHHVKFRSDHGATEMWNLVSLCVECHSLVHAGLLVIEGTDEKSIRFLDAKGEPLGGDPNARREAAAALVLPSAVPTTPPAPAPETVTIDTVPETTDGAWWLRHGHLVRFGSKGLELHAGAPVDLPASLPPSEVVPWERAFAGIVGQDALLARLQSVAKGSEARGRPFPHTLLVGPAGMGKTTLAHGLASCFGRRLLKATGPLLQDVHELVRLVADLREGDVLFLEEVHAVPRPVLEALYEAMAERRLSLTLHAGARVRTVRLDLPAFTLIAATTEDGDLPAPFVSRFGLHEVLGECPTAALAFLIADRAKAEGFVLDPDAAKGVARVARGTPREALRLLDRVLDDAASRGERSLAGPAVAGALARLGFDEEGLRPLEQRYVALLRRTGAPISLRVLARMLGAPWKTLLRDVEPFLRRRGLIQTSSKGRSIVLRPRLLEA